MILTVTTSMSKVVNCKLWFQNHSSNELYFPMAFAISVSKIFNSVKTLTQSKLFTPVIMMMVRKKCFDKSYKRLNYKTYLHVAQ